MKEGFVDIDSAGEVGLVLVVRSAWFRRREKGLWVARGHEQRERGRGESRRGDDDGGRKESWDEETVTGTVASAGGVQESGVND